MPYENMNKRISYYGNTQQDRMNRDKLETLKKAMLYSYQAATIRVNDKDYRCLINPNKLNLDVDNKILSIPFEQDIQEGAIIEWKHNENTYSHWLVYLQHIEETAYFRAELRRCRHQITFENGTTIWAYVRGPVEQNVVWRQGGGNYFNTLNYTLQMLVPKNESTEKLCSRFAKITIEGKPWEIQAADKMTNPGIIELYLKEDYTQNFQETAVLPSEDDQYEIKGAAAVNPYQEYTYTSTGEGTWSVENMSRKKAVKVISAEGNTITLFIETGKSGKFDLVYGSSRRTIIINSL